MRIHKTLKNSLKKSQKKWRTSSRRARNIARKRVDTCKQRGSSGRFGGGGCSKRVSDKLEALKSLIPHQYHQLHVEQEGDGRSNEGAEAVVHKADQLFQETADYIIVLKTQVFVLQKLIEFYDNNSKGSRKNDDQNHVHQSSS